MQIEWRPKSAGKWHPFQWEAILYCPTAQGHRVVPSSVSRNGDCLHVWLTGRADKAISESALKAGKPGHRGRCKVTLHAVEHGAPRTAVRLSSMGKQRGGGVRRGRDQGKRGTERNPWGGRRGRETPLGGRRGRYTPLAGRRERSTERCAHGTGRSRTIPGHGR